LGPDFGQNIRDQLKVWRGRIRAVGHFRRSKIDLSPDSQVHQQSGGDQSKNPTTVHKQQ
jgi:hypothetical protein